MSLPDYEEYQHDHKRSHRRYVLVGKLQDDPNIEKIKNHYQWRVKTFDKRFWGPISALLHFIFLRSTRTSL